MCKVGSCTALVPRFWLSFPPIRTTWQLLFGAQLPSDKRIHANTVWPHIGLEKSFSYMQIINSTSIDDIGLFKKQAHPPCNATCSCCSLDIRTAAEPNRPVLSHQKSGSFNSKIHEFAYGGCIPTPWPPNPPLGIQTREEASHFYANFPQGCPWARKSAKNERNKFEMQSPTTSNNRICWVNSTFRWSELGRNAFHQAYTYYYHVQAFVT